MTKALLEITPELQREAKILAAQKGCTLKQLGKVVVTQGLADIKAGTLKLDSSDESEAKPETAQK